MTLLSSSRVLAAGAASVIAAACAPQTPGTAHHSAAGQRQCFLPSQVTTFRPIDDDTVNVFVGPSDVYTLQLTGPCLNVDWSLQIGIRSTGGGSWICGDLDAELIVPSPMGTQRCPVASIQKLDPEAARAARRS